MNTIFFGSIGTIIDASEMQREAFNMAFADHGLGWHWTRDDYGAMLGRSGGAGRVAAYASAKGMEVDATAVHRTKSQRFLEMLRDSSLGVRPGVLDVLNFARERSHKTGFISTTEAASVAAIIAKLSAMNAPPFDVVTSRALGVAEKPAPDAYLHALRELGAAPSEAIAIENNPDGIEAANSAGVRVVTFPGELDDLSSIASRHSGVAGSLIEGVQAAIAEGQKA